MPVNHAGAESSGPALTLTSELRALHARAGAPSTRAIARELTDVSHTTVAEALNGRRVPSWPVLAKIVTVLADNAEMLQNAGSEEAFQEASIQEIFRSLWEAATERPTTDSERTGALHYFFARYRRQVAVSHGSLEPPDFARRRRVPISELYNQPQIVALSTDSAGAPLPAIDLWEFDKKIGRTVLLGDPGAGKTSACQALMHRHATDSKLPIPFLITLRNFAARSPETPSVIGYIEQRLGIFYQCPPPAGLIEQLLFEGSALVIFDGLDELIDTTYRSELSSIIELFCSEFPDTKVLVTSRTVGYNEARLDETQFATYELAGFTEDETAAYVRNWFALEDDTDASAVAEAFMRESGPAADLRSNPLMLALMCILYRGEGTLPRNRPGVYAECARLLFDKWDTRRGIHVDLQARNLIEPTLRNIAYWLFTRDGSPEVTEQELIRQVTDVLHERAFEQRHDAEAAASEFVAFCRGRAWILVDAGTTARGEALYTFSHHAFLEYFTAAYLAWVHDTPEELAHTLAPHVAKDEWDIVGQLAIQIMDTATNRGAERAITTLMNEYEHGTPKERANIQAFLTRCLEVVEIPPALSRILIEASHSN